MLMTEELVKTVLEAQCGNLSSPGLMAGEDMHDERGRDTDACRIT
jgi:hypothetical protein